MTRTIAAASPLLALALAGPLTSGCKNQCGGSLHEACDTTIGTTSDTTETGTTASATDTSTTTTTTTGATTTTDPTEASTTQTSTSTTGQPPVCGDGNLDDGEECDNGTDNADTSACTSQCKAAVCGDGLVHAGVESCDDANSDNTDACIACQFAACGDGYTQAGEEECDDGNAENTDGCTDACQRDRLVFASSLTFDGSLTPQGKPPLMGDAIARADKQCNDLATSAKLPGTFMAWISTLASSPNDRFPFEDDFSGRFLLRKGDQYITIANSWTGLRTPPLQAPIDHDESGTAVSSPKAAWTNTKADGSQDTLDCDSWTSNDSSKSGYRGGTDLTSDGWSHLPNSHGCDAFQRIYCFQVTP